MPEDDNRIDRREERRATRVVWSQEFYEGRVRQEAIYDPALRTVHLCESVVKPDGSRSHNSVVMEEADLRKIVTAIGY